MRRNGMDNWIHIYREQRRIPIVKYISFLTTDNNLMIDHSIFKTGIYVLTTK
jgi:hypothetical protein